MGTASARAVRARSWAEIPVVVPVCVYSLLIRGTRKRWGTRTVFVIDRDCVCGPVSLLVLRDHHRDGQRLEAFTWERDTDVPAVWVNHRGVYGERPNVKS